MPDWEPSGSAHTIHPPGIGFEFARGIFGAVVAANPRVVAKDEAECRATHIPCIHHVGKA
jgi:hypothetical protein